MSSLFSLESLNELSVELQSLLHRLPCRSFLQSLLCAPRGTMLLRTTFPFLILSFFVSLGTLLLPSQHVECANILAVFPHNGLSHWMFFRPIVSELVRSGRHNVTLLSYFGIEDDELQGRDNFNEFLFTQQSVLTNSFDMEVSKLKINKTHKIKLIQFPALHSIV